MSTVVILGAGDIGGALARQLAEADIVSRIAIVDDAASVAAGKALDIAQAGPVDGYTTSLSGTADVAAVVGAAVVVFADKASQPPVEWQDEAGLALLKRVAGLNQLAPIVFAGTSQTSLIERGVTELGIARARLIGSAPEALRSAVVTVVALEAGASPTDISLSVVGRPPHSVIVPWEETSIAGQSATQVLSAAQLARLDTRITKLWPTGPNALGSAAARIIKTALTRGTRVHMAMVALAQGEGTPGRAAMLPVQVQPSGLSKILTPTMSSRDRVRLETTLRS